jgi:hypothetical protein
VFIVFNYDINIRPDPDGSKYGYEKREAVPFGTATPKNTWQLLDLD